MKTRSAIFAASLALLWAASVTSASAGTIGGPADWFAFDFFFPSNFELSQCGGVTGCTTGYPNDNFLFLQLGTASAPSIGNPVSVSVIYAIVDLHNNTSDGIPNVGGLYSGFSDVSSEVILNADGGYSFDQVQFNLDGVTFLVSDPQGSFTLDLTCPTCTSGPITGSFNEPTDYGPLVTTPIPAALPLLATGLGALLLLGRRRKRKAAALATA